MNLRLEVVAGALLVLIFGNSFLIAQDQPLIKLWPEGLPAGSVQLDPAKVRALKEKEKVHPPRARALLRYPNTIGVSG